MIDQDQRSVADMPVWGPARTEITITGIPTSFMRNDPTHIQDHTVAGKAWMSRRRYRVGGMLTECRGFDTMEALMAAVQVFDATPAKLPLRAR